MSCANTAYCGVYRGDYTVFLEPFVRYSLFLFQSDGVDFSDGQIRVTEGFIRQPFNVGVLRLIAGRNETIKPFLSTPHDFILAITNGYGETVWHKNFI